MAYDGSGFIDLGVIKDQIPVNDGVMPVAYGYLLGYLNEKEKDNVDALIFSTHEFKTGDKLEVEVFGMLVREDGDHKVLVKDASLSIDSFERIPLEQNQLILDYFGHKSKIQMIEQKTYAENYLDSCKEV